MVKRLQMNPFIALVIVVALLLAHATFAQQGGGGAPGAGSGNAGYPTGATPLTAIFSGADTTSATATLAGAAGQFTYICGFNLGGLGATAATPVTPTVTGITNTFTLVGAFTFVAGAANTDAPVSFTFQPCIPASALNTGVVVTLPGAAGNTSANINVWGYRQ